ncbi:MAG: DsbC family protein [Ferrovum sp.]|nr:DsbC family protein [Ferrovum sp.]NDU88208.1 DsbC family protein [Ferrovum sp.]
MSGWWNSKRQQSVSLVCGGVLVGLLSLSAQGDEAALRQKLQQKLPKLAPHVVQIHPAHALGLYELYTDDRQIIYVDEGVTTLVAGDLIEAQSLHNLTEERLKVLGAVKPSELPLNLAMKRVKGNGKRVVAVFSDPDCPFCRKLEKELTGITDVTVYTFLYPIGSLHPDAPERAHWIACAHDPEKAWEDYQLKNVEPVHHQCKDKLESVQALGEKYGINGTPTLVFADGSVIPGALPRAELERALGPD